MFADWNQMSDELQVLLTREAMRRAAATIAGQAEVLAAEMESGGLSDRGGPDALRLFAAIIRVNGTDALLPAGHA